MCVNREDVEKIVQDRLELVTTKIDGQFDLISQKLGTIENDGKNSLNQLSRINGRVHKSEENIRDLQEHISNREIRCPYKDRVRNVEDRMLETTSVKKFMYKGFGVTIAIMSLLFTALAIYVNII